MKNPLRLLAATACAAGLLAGCGGGDIEISADDNSVVNDNSQNTGGGGSNNPCANYTDPDTNTLQQGTFDGQNCIYSSDFVGENNPLTVDLTIPLITGVHIFEDSLFVGENVDNAPTPQCGNTLADACDGPTLTIRAGNTLAWTQASDYLLINRGSRIIAEGSPTSPITFTGTVDAVQGTAGPEAVQLWGGVVINGNGITNKCDDDQRATDSCHILSEGKPSNYGGANNEESSGVLEYVVVKHTGFEVAPGDELNGITFNAVGSGTEVNHVQVYSTFDDGVEFFGGAVEVERLVAVFVKDDSIDYADGWVGSVNQALVIHSSTDGNRCIEADNQGDDFDAVPLTNPVVSNMTCITSGSDAGTHGDSEGVLLRRGVASTILNSIVAAPAVPNTSTLTAVGSNECFELNDDQTYTLASDGTTNLQSVLLVCEEPTKGCRTFDANGDCTDENFASGETVEEWVLTATANSGNVILTDTTPGSLNILNGIFTAESLTDANGDPVAITPVDVDGDPDTDDFLGAVLESDDWTATWTFGITEQNLWFNPRP
jgi:hypothetical protein